MSPVQPGLYRLRNVKSGTYLDESNKDPDTVHGWDSRPQNNNQKWVLEPAGDGFHIRNAGHGRYLSTSGPHDNAAVKATQNQSTWTFKHQGRGYAIYLQGTGHVIDLDQGRDENGTHVNVWGYTGAHQQLWDLEEIGGYGGGQQQPQQQQQYQQQQQQQQQQQPQQYGGYGGAAQGYSGPLQPGNYRVHNVFTGTALDLAGGSSNEGTPIIAWSVGNGQNQVWSFQPGTQGYRIKNNASGTYLAYGNLNRGELLAGHNQAPEWQVTQADNGYQLHPAQNTGLVVDLAEGKKEDGAKICLWDNNSQDNQKWRIDRA